MKDIDALENKSLDQLSIFSGQELAHLFQNYNIITLGQLLGATRGLSRRAIFDSFADGDHTISALLRIVPVQLLKKHREPTEIPPLGCIEEDAFADEEGGDDETQ